MNKGRQKNIFIALLAILIILLLVAIFFTVSSIIDVNKKTEEIKVVEENRVDEPEPDEDKLVPGKDEKDKEEDKEEDKDKEEEKPKEPEENTDNNEGEEVEEEKPEENNEETEEPVEEEIEPEENPQVSSGSVFVNTESLNVRQEASTDSLIVANVSQGSELYVLGSSNGWINVQVAPGLTGYVSSEYVSGGGNLGTNDNEGVTQGSNASVTGDSVAVRMEANNNSSIVIYVNQGDPLVILDSQGDWYYVRLSNGFLGYIHKDFVG